jgi:hypothetical protein
MPGTASDEFVEKHCGSFAGASSAGEQRLEWQQLYLDYCSLYERALEDFVASQGCTVETFVGACRDALDNSAWTDHRGLAACVLAMAEYEYFLRMMSMAAADGSEATAAADGHEGPSAHPRPHAADEEELYMPSAEDGLGGVDEYGEVRPGLETETQLQLHRNPLQQQHDDDGGEDFM